MEFTFSTDITREEYNRFVSEHESGSFLQSWEWGDFTALNGKAPLRVAVKNLKGEILLVAQIFNTPLPKVKTNYLYVPYGPLIAKDAEVEKVLKFFIVELRIKHLRAGFLRIESKDALPLLGRVTRHIQPGKTLVLDLTKTESELLAEMHTKTRYNIKVAERHEVAVNTTSDSGAEGIKLIEQTAQRQNYKSHSSEYYKKIVAYFNGLTQSNVKVSIYEAAHENTVLASALIIDFGQTRTYLFGGTSDEKRNTMAPYSMHWQAICDAKAAGIKTYDFWGIETASGETPGFVRFKLGWGGTQVAYPATQDIIWRPLWYTTYTFLRSVRRKIS